MTNLNTMKLKALHHPEHHLAKQLSLQIHIENFNAKKACLSKYFPKYYRNLEIKLPVGDWASNKRLELTKMIECFTWDIKEKAKQIDKLEQKIFRTKRKSVRSFPLFYSPSEREWFRSDEEKRPKRPKFSTLYPRLRSLNLSSIKGLKQGRMDQLFASRQLEQQIKHSYGYFWGSLRYLEHLEISNNNSNFWFMIQQVNSSPRFLSSLKTLKLSLSFSANPANNLRVRGLLHQLAKNGQLLKHVTHLNCKKFEILHHFDELMGSILSQCSALVYLNILIGRESWYWTEVKDVFPEHRGTQVFEQIRKLSKLQALNVSAYGIESFAKHFSVPPSVKDLDLYVGKSLTDSSWLGSFQEPEYNFFERWKNLPNLNTFKLKMSIIDKPDRLFTEFMNPLLEAISSKGNLQKLRFEITSEAIYCRVPQNSVVDFSLLFNGKNFAFPKLESLEILTTREYHSTFNPKEYHDFFSGLKDFRFTGEPSGEFDAKSVLQLFAASKDQSQKRRLELSNLTFKSIETFEVFLKFMKKVAVGSAGNLELHLNLELHVKSLQTLFDHFQQQSVHLNENCIVNLEICLEKAAYWVDRIEELSEEEFHNLQKIFVSFFKLKVAQDGNRTLLQR